MDPKDYSRHTKGFHTFSYRRVLGTSYQGTDDNDTHLNGTDTCLVTEYPRDLRLKFPSKLSV